MSANHANSAGRTLACALCSAALALLTGLGSAQAATVPIELVPTGAITSELQSPLGVAVNEDPASPEYGDVYVTDVGLHRVEVLSPGGALVEMFGREVDATTGGDVCTAASGDTCQAGAGGSAPGQFAGATSVAVDPSSGDVYVAEQVIPGLRVQEFTAEGRWVLELGREVNATKDANPAASAVERNLCTQKEVETEGASCTGPAKSVYGGSEPGAFDFASGNCDLLAAGGSEHLLYVGDEHRVQEFNPAGGWVGEIPLTSISAEPGRRVQALALDQERGDLYLVYQNVGLVRELSPEGQELSSIEVAPRHQGNETSVQALALDRAGHLSVLAGELGKIFGTVYDAVSGRRFGEFPLPGGANPTAIALTGEHQYATNFQSGEVLVYAQETIAALTAGGAGCEPGAEDNTSATFDCTLHGEVDPEGVAETEALFELGRTPALGETTAAQQIQTAGPVQATVNVRPNATYYYRLAGFDQNARPPVPITSEAMSLHTPAVAPRIVGAPTAPSIGASSALVFSELNPENAHTEYRFEYAPGERALAGCAGVARAACPGVGSTPVAASAAYGRIGAGSEVSALQPATVYSFRLSAESAGSANPAERFAVTGPEGSFTTAAKPRPSAQTGAASAITSTSAVVAGTVDPDGLPAGYRFELGVYNGADTRYTVVSSGSAGAERAPVGETLAVTGLQPGTTYAYRIAITGSYIENETHALQGAPVTFTTAGIADVLAVPETLPLLSVPAVAFPATAAPRSTVKAPSRAQRRAKALKACKRKPARRRAACERRARTVR